MSVYRRWRITALYLYKTVETLTERERERERERRWNEFPDVDRYSFISESLGGFIGSGIGTN